MYNDYIIDKLNGQVTRFQEEILEIVEELRKLRRNLGEIRRDYGYQTYKKSD